MILCSITRSLQASILVGIQKAVPKSKADSDRGVAFVWTIQRLIFPMPRRRFLSSGCCPQDLGSVRIAEASKPESKLCPKPLRLQLDNPEPCIVASVSEQNHSNDVAE